MAQSVTRPAGTFSVPAGAHVTVGGTGSLFVKQQVQEYVPPATETIRLWITSNDSVDGSRGAARQLGARPATYATTQSGVTPSGFTLQDGDAFGTGIQNGMTILQLSPDSTGITGTWGPLSANWTLSLFMRADRPVNDFGGYPGYGAMTLLSSAAVGVSLTLPTGGSIPTDAVSQNGGPLDGVAPGWTWDLPFLNHWRHLCIRNSASSGVRTTFVDGYPASTTAATTSAVPAGTAMTIFAHCPVSFAELMIWDGADLSNADIASLREPLRRKWGVPTLPHTERCLPKLRPACLCLSGPQPWRRGQLSRSPPQCQLPGCCQLVRLRPRAGWTRQWGHRCSVTQPVPRRWWPTSPCAFGRTEVETIATVHSGPGQPPPRGP